MSMVNKRFLYAKLLLLKIQNHPLFAINQQFHWPYEGNYKANTADPCRASLPCPLAVPRYLVGNDKGGRATG